MSCKAFVHRTYECGIGSFVRDSDIAAFFVTVRFCAKLPFMVGTVKIRSERLLTPPYQSPEQKTRMTESSPKETMALAIFLQRFTP